ncbi:olfactory receptor 6B1-like [Protopterus annectens]|uniref:olfactory receptor 6B1-like n=1 Tax=Protopterus annectens TaxID=7888 RepID=UPI001CFAE7B5|nr:olfactory receptor 6B1-like [Protopterus annectens]
MENWNQSASPITFFIIAGIPGLRNWEERGILFVIFFIIYTVTFTENLMFIAVIRLDHGLHSPMYLFICNLAFLDLLIPSVTIPEMLYYLATGDGHITFGPCIMQMAFYLIFLVTESFILAVMAYDRYQAICNPLLYPTVMTTRQVFLLSVFSWTMGSIYASSYVYIVLSANFCGPNTIKYFCCDYSSIMLLACADVSSQRIYDKLISLFIMSVQLFLILFSYGKIITTVFRTSSTEGQRKAFSTCASHILVIGIFYLFMAFVLISFGVAEISDQVRTLSAIVQNVVPSMINPVIYCAKTKEIRISIMKMLKKMQL